MAPPPAAATDRLNHHPRRLNPFARRATSRPWPAGPDQSGDTGGRPPGRARETENPMPDEERRIISQYGERIAGAAAPAAPASPWGGSVPSTQARPSLPPVDREADAL